MKVLIMAGGTGGHVFPALAVAQALRARGHEIVWMGAPDSFESRTVAPHGFPMEFIRITGLRGKGWKTLLMAPLHLFRAVREALAALSRQRPAVVLGMGGFASGPGGLAARLRRVPLVIHEQNAASGLTNRVLARFATAVLEAFPGTFRRASVAAASSSQGRARTVGNPVRAEIVAVAPPAERFAARNGPARVQVFGGSQGARALNELLPKALALIPGDERPQVRHQAGRTLDVARAAYTQAGVAAQVEGFISDMPAAYADADLIVCRAGASTIAELAAVGVASVLVPFPHAVDDHQTANARYLADAGAAILIQELDLDAQKLATLLRELLADRSRLLAMAQAARGKAWPDATDAIVDAVLHAGGSR